MMSRLIAFLIRACMNNPLVVGLLLILMVAFGITVAPFDWGWEHRPIRPVAVDAIPDIGENQQIVYTEWTGRSPRDVEDQITFPLTSSLLGLPGIKTVRSNSMFGFSMIYVIFEDGVDFYFSRTRILEKLSSLPPGTLPREVTPTLGPDATALGQIFWYTLEGRDESGRPAGGWDPRELRSVQDWTVRFALQSVKGVAEVASVGGFVQEYQVDVFPYAMKNYGITFQDILRAVRRSNLDVGAKSIEVNGSEYVIRGLGFIKGIRDLELAVVKVVGNVPIRIREIAEVTLGPAPRRGLLDKAGAEAVGGVVVSRFGANPLETLGLIEKKIEEIAAGLPVRVLADGRESRVTVVPFYNRGHLIRETLQTLNDALSLEIIVTLVVILLMVMHLRAALLISGLLPLTVLATFIAMRLFKVDANIVALSGIAIAIGTIVDMGIVLCENILRRVREKEDGKPLFELVFKASTEVGPAVLTAVATTIIGFLPVFFMEGAEGKLFKPLAYTKTFALLSSIAITLALVPTLSWLILRKRSIPSWSIARWVLVALALVLALFVSRQLFLVLVVWVVAHQAVSRLPAPWLAGIARALRYLAIGLGFYWLSGFWTPLGVHAGTFKNLLFTGLLVAGIMVLFFLFIKAYPHLLAWCLAHKPLFLSAPAMLIMLGLAIWLGFDRVAGWFPRALQPLGIERQQILSTRFWSWASHQFPGLGKEFMPNLDEGSFLYMPSTMPHASLTEAQDILTKMDMAIQALPEVEEVVGKLGRVESSLDPAPLSMIETLVSYHPEYRRDDQGGRLYFEYDHDREQFVRDAQGNLIEDSSGKPFRQWRDHIRSPADIWNEIARAAVVPGATGAPMLQPIATRLVMLQSGMRAAMGLKVKGPDLAAIERAGIRLEALLRQVPGIIPESVFAERIMGKPYLEFHIDREEIARYGLNVQDVTDVIEMAIGGKTVSYTVEGRERYPIRIRYPRELRGDPEEIQNTLIPVRANLQIPLRELASLRYTPGPQSIRSENASLVGYVTFGKAHGISEVEIVNRARDFLNRKLSGGALILPKGVSYQFAGSYENQIRSERRLAFILPIALSLIFLILYLQFKSKSTTLFIFLSVFVAWSGGFLMLWLFGKDWFLDFSLFGANLREVFQIRPYHLSVAVWVGFLALFGIATDDGVIMGTYLKQSFEREKPDTLAGLRAATVVAGSRRIRPCLMTSATTILALMPILTSTGRGADIMIPMAIPSFGGMVAVLLTVFVVPTLYCWAAERRLAHGGGVKRG